MMYIRLTERGVARVLSGMAGMVFKVKCFTPGAVGDVAHVYDFRFVNGNGPQVWSIAADGYDKMADADALTYQIIKRLQDELRIERDFVRDVNVRKQRIYDSLKSEIAHRNKLETKVGELERALKSCAEGREAVATWGAKAQNEVLRLSALLDERRMELAKLQDVAADTTPYVVGFHDTWAEDNDPIHYVTAGARSRSVGFQGWDYTNDRTKALRMTQSEARSYVMAAPAHRFMERA